MSLLGLVIVHHHGVQSQDNHLGILNLQPPPEKLLQQRAENSQIRYQEKAPKNLLTAWEESICSGAISRPAAYPASFFKASKRTR